MHELGLTQQIVHVCSDRAGSRSVRRVVLEIGKVSCVLPDALRFSFELCTPNTPLAGAELEIVEIPGRARCRGCGRELALDQPYGLCECGATDLEWLTGQELRIREMEVC